MVQYLHFMILEWDHCIHGSYDFSEANTIGHSGPRCRPENCKPLGKETAGGLDVMASGCLKRSSLNQKCQAARKEDVPE